MVEEIETDEKETKREKCRTIREARRKESTMRRKKMKDICLRRNICCTYVVSKIRQ